MAVKSGEDFEMISFDSTQVRIDGEAVKALLATLQEKGLILPEQAMACYKEIKMHTVKTERKDKAKALPFKMPELANATDMGLVDMLGQTRERIKHDKKLEGVYKAALEARLTANGEGAPSPAPAYTPSWKDEDE